MAKAGVKARTTAGGSGTVLRALAMLAFASAVVAGCSPKGGSEQQHAPAAKELLPYERIGSGAEIRTESSADAEVIAFLKENKVADTEKVIAAAEKSDSPEKKAELLRKAADLLLQQDLITPKAALNDDLIQVFHRFTEQLVKTSRYSHARETTGKILARYEALVLAGCDPALKKCLNLRYFVKVGNVRDVLSANLAAPGSEACAGAEDGGYHLRVIAAYALAPVGTDEPRLDALYLRCAMPRLRAIEKMKEGRTRDEATEHMSIALERILSRSDRLNSSPELAEMIAGFRAELKPELYVESLRPATPVERILFEARRASLLRNAAAINDPAFVQTVRKLNYERRDPYNYDRIQEMFAETKTPIVANLKIETIAARDELYTIVDAVATKRWLPATGVAFFEKLKKEDPEKTKKALEGVVKAYTQAMFLKEIVETNGDMADFYRNNTVSSNELIQEAIDASQGLQKNWVEFYARIEVLREFSSSALNLPSTRLAHLGLDLKSLVLASNYMIAFPHMLMMAFELAEKKFDIKIQTWFGVIHVNYVDVIEWIFEGNMLPWFTYAPGASNEKKEYMFNNTQVLQSLYFAFRTEAFKVFKVDEQKFLKTVIDTLTFNHIVLYQDSLHLRTESYQRYSEEAARVRAACSEERKRSDAKREGKNYVPRYEAEVPFEEIRDGLLSTTRWFKALTGKIIDHNAQVAGILVRQGKLGLNLSNYHESERFDMQRLGTGRVVRLIESILEIYRQFLKDKGVPASEIEKRIANVSGGYRKLQHEQRRYHTVLGEFLDNFSKGCLIRLQLRENELFNQVWKEEINHLRGIHRDKAKILSGEAKYEDLAAKYKFQGYESVGYTGWDDFSGDAYRYTILDAHMRLNRHLAKVAPYVSVDMPTPETLKDKSSFRDKARVAYISFFDSEGKLVSEDDFVRAALSFGGDPDVRSWKYFYNWEPAFNVQHIWQTNNYHTEIMTVLYKLGEVEQYPQNRPDCLGQTPPQGGCPVEKRKFLTPDELVQQQSDLAWLVSVKPDEEADYELRGIPSKMKFDFIMQSLGGSGTKTYDAATVGTLMDPRYGTPTGFFDYPLHYMMSEYFGVPLKLLWTTPDEQSGNHMPLRYPLQRHLTWYYEAETALEYIPFAIDKETKKALDDVYRGSFQVEDNFVRDYVRAVERRKVEDEKVGYKRRLRRTLYDEPYFGPYLTPNYVHEYNRSIVDFHRDTKGFFLDGRKPGEQQ